LPVQKLVDDINLNSHQISRGDIIVTSDKVGQRYTGSISLMMAEKRYVQVQLSGNVYGGTNPYVNVDLLTGTIVQANNVASSSIERMAQGFYLISVTQIVSSAGNTGINVLLLDENKNTQYSGDGFSGVYLFNGQMELGFFSSSPIINQGTIQTRGADLININQENFLKTIGNLKELTFLYSAKKSKYRNAFTYYFRFQAETTAGGSNYLQLVDHSSEQTVYHELYNDGVKKYSSYKINNFNAPSGSFFSNVVSVKTDAITVTNGVIDNTGVDGSIPKFTSFNLYGTVNTIISHFALWNTRLTNAEIQAITSGGLAGKNPNQIPTNADVNRSAFVAPETILSTTGRQHFSLDCTGASQTRNIRFPFDFTYEVVDSTGVTITTAPSATCTANTDYPLVINGAVGKTFTYAITPVFEY
jgi:hypothetical protein